MNSDARNVDFWDLRDVDLAKHCLRISEEESLRINAAIKAEAGRLYVEWCENMDGSEVDRKERAQRAALRAALRKRTIQILVKLSLLDEKLTRAR